MSSERTDAGSSTDPDDSEAAYGGADAVPPTSAGTRPGTDPDARPPAESRPGAPDGDFNWPAWIAVALAVILTVAFGLGAFG